jgi:predicted dehydrogenase
MTNDTLTTPADDTRRGFLRKAAAAGIAGPAVQRLHGSQRSPNDTIHIAVVGFHGRGRDHYRTFAAMPNVRVAYLCDIDERLFPAAVAEVEKISGSRPGTIVDFRRLIERKDIDAVSIATPDHWHALQTVWACQAGKDVYVEKPVSYTLREGRKMVQAARKYRRIVQVGLNRRSELSTRSIARYVQAGEFGPAYRAKAVIFRGRLSVGRVEEASIPEGVNWDLFLGPAPYRAYTLNRFHYGWHNFWDTSTSEIGNNGVHALDVVRWGLGKNTHPVRVHCVGGRFADEDTDQETPNVAVASFAYADGTLVDLEMTTLYSPKFDGVSIGAFFYTPKGYINSESEGKTVAGRFTARDRPGFYADAGVAESVNNLSFPDIAYEPGPAIPMLEEKEVDHFENFIAAMRSRRIEDLHCEVEEGHLSTSLCHLANIALRTRRALVFDPASEAFPGDEEANALLTRTYREPYTMPDEV